jgi:molybdenum-dependent DNA-binding transcriptional regulator ModE
MAITLRQIRYFVATAEVGQISQAAIHLHISQSSVTSAIQELEALLGAPLFIRSPEGLELVNYRVQDKRYEIDRIFEEAELRLGNRKPVIVSIHRKAPKAQGEGR